MTITLGIPEALETQLGGGTPQQVSRQVLEAVVLEAYREDRLGGPQAAEMLGFSRLEWDHPYSVEDLERDVATIQLLRAEGVLRPAV